MIEKSIDVKRALVSVYHKDGILEFCRILNGLGIQILSTGGTAKHLLENQIPVTDVSEHTGFPEMLSGRVKTLHPKVHGGILYRRDHKEDQAAVHAHGITGIDLVVVNLYPFSETVARKGVTLTEVVENIDIGGPAMLRSAAKNFEHVGVVTDQSDYAVVATELEHSRGRLTYETRQRLMLKAFERTAAYDSAISAYFEQLQGHDFPASLTRHLTKVSDLRYGENPHQKAAVYSWKTGIAQSKFLGGKEMSYNNWMDAYAAYQIAREFESNEQSVAVIVKHNNPCGGAVDSNQANALTKALQTDPTSAFGGVYAFNTPMTVESALLLKDQFVEVIISNGFEPGAVEVLLQKPNRRLLDASGVWDEKPGMNLVKIGGSVLVQDADTQLYHELKTVTARKPTDEEKSDLDFAWRFCKHTKSNAIVFAKNKQIVGIGAGQMSRIDSVKLAGIKAQSANLVTKGAVMASDAFFPFADGIEAAAKLGIAAVMQPGGSLKDQDVIVAADKLGLAMMFTGMRHFRH
ncbi:bifunctional phosphoribosylaminoimidazolecarboxamide formyltransferase/IMP cyclohydrolase [Candidatus Micrarchaeota archaeon]|nr:bifunctional phosphoribosylaminoimidazolecarboxamide formyltransferase/IMP cyclohydrolase [Candidatus Micrarchaeota archaeon]